MKQRFFFLLLIMMLCLTTISFADPMYFPDQKEALQKYGRSTSCLIDAAFHNESGYSMVAVQNEQVYQLTILQKMNDQEWKLIAINDNISLNQGRITDVGVDTYEIIDPTDRRYAFRIEFDNPPLSNHAFTVSLNEAGEWQIQHIEGTILTSEKKYSQCILEPSGNNAWKIKYRVIDDMEIYDQQESVIMLSDDFSSPAFDRCDPLALLEEAFSPDISGTVPNPLWSIEEKAAFSNKQQSLNTDWQNPRYRLPAENEITKEQAKTIAVQALNDTYSITEKDLSAWDYQESLEYTDPDFPEDDCFYHFLWINHTETATHPGGDLYEVCIDPLTGEIISIQSNDDMVG